MDGLIVQSSFCSSFNRLPKFFFQLIVYDGPSFSVTLYKLIHPPFLIDLDSLICIIIAFVIMS